MQSTSTALKAFDRTFYLEYIKHLKQPLHRLLSIRGPRLNVFRQDQSGLAHCANNDLLICHVRLLQYE